MDHRSSGGDFRLGLLLSYPGGYGDSVKTGALRSATAISSTKMTIAAEIRNQSSCATGKSDTSQKLRIAQTSTQ